MQTKVQSWAGKIPGEGNGYLLQYSGLGNPMDRGAWWATAHGVTRHTRTACLETRREELLQATAIFSGCHSGDQILTQGPMGLPWVESKVHPVFQPTPPGIGK